MFLRFFMLFFVLLAPACTTSTVKPQQQATIIILNGTPCTGKSSIQKALQESFDRPYLKVGIDQFFVGVLPEKFLMGTAQIKGPEDVVMTASSTQEDEKPIFSVNFGPQGTKTILGMHQAIAGYAAAGNNVIVDYILYDHAWIKDLCDVLKNFDRVYFVGINASLEAIEQREKDRATSPQGHARSIYNTIHKDLEYDLFIDNTNLNATQCAEIIKTFVEQNPQPHAFKKNNR